MPLFKLKPRGSGIHGQEQEVMCPRCRITIEGTEAYMTGEGIDRRKIEGEYNCSCGYKCIVIETFPIINYATGD